MNRKEVKQQIQHYTKEDLITWRAHVVKCLEYYMKYPDEFEIEECNFVISHIDERLREMNVKEKKET